LTKTPEPPITVAALPEGKKSAERSVGSDEPNPMTQSMQKELKRVGCYSGEVDGKWGEGTRDAVQEFADESKMVLSTSEPTEVALNVLTASKTGVCSSKSDEKTVQKSAKSRRQAKSSSGRSSKSSGSSGTIIFGVGKGVGVGIGF
jgi:peptidoglycan hydrolase-like protein with peptidoglycan-binding domain